MSEICDNVPAMHVNTPAEVIREVMNKYHGLRSDSVILSELVTAAWTHMYSLLHVWVFDGLIKRDIIAAAIWPTTINLLIVSSCFPIHIVTCGCAHRFQVLASTLIPPDGLSPSHTHTPCSYFGLPTPLFVARPREFFLSFLSLILGCTCLSVSFPTFLS